MPSLPHELLVDIMREHPRVVHELVRGLLGTVLGDAELVAAPATLREITPPEYRADLVLVGRHLRTGRPRAAIVVEIQLARDSDKRYSWPFYIVGLRARLRCPVALVVITLDRRVARWARRPIVLDGLHSSVTPVVVGPDDIPQIVEPLLASEDPELALLSLLAHADDPAGTAIGYAVLRACDRLDETRARLYTDLVFAYLDDTARRRLEAMMDLDKYEFQSDFMKRLTSRAIAEGLARGQAEGLARGQAEGLARGQAEGLARGQAEGLARGQAEGQLAALRQAVIDLLEARQIVISERQRATIVESSDPEQLRAWLIATATASSVDELAIPS